MNQERLMTVLVAPIVSEKATMVAEKNGQVAFRVLQDATKDEIRALVAQSQKRSAVFDIVTNPTDVTVEVK